MKKIILILCLILITGCSSSENAEEKATELDDIKREIYQEAYEEGYNDAMDAILDEIPYQVIDMEELEDALHIIFDDGDNADEIRDQILSYCELYEYVDFMVNYSESDMDYNY